MSGQPLNPYVVMGILVGIAFGIIFLAAIITIISVRIRSNGALYVAVWGITKKPTTKLIKPHGENSWIMVGPTGEPSGTDAKKFVFDVEKEHSVDWPEAAPAWLQVQLPAYYYRDDQSEPIDPRGKQLARIVSPESLNLMTNEAVFKAALAEAREAAEGQLLSRRIPKLILIGTITLVVLVGVSTAVSYKTMKDVQRLVQEIIPEASK